MGKSVRNTAAGVSLLVVLGFVAPSQSRADASSEVARGLVSNPRRAVEDWQGAVQRAKQREWTGWLGNQRRSLDTWIAKGSERPELVAGWVHDYVDAGADTGAGAGAGADAGAGASAGAGAVKRWSAETPAPPEGSTEPQMRTRRAWVAYMRSFNIAQTQVAAQLFRLTGDAKYADWAVAQLNLYAQNYNRWPLRTQNGRGRMFQNGLDEAYQSFALLSATRLLEARLGPEGVRQLRDGLFYPMAENLKVVTSPLTNIGLWQSVAIAAIAMRFRDDTLLDYAINNSQGIRATLKEGLTADDIWKEGSFLYNSYVADALSKLLLHASLEGYSERFGVEGQALQRLVVGPWRFRFADGTLPTPGDGNPGRRAIDTTLLQQIYRVLPTSFGLEAAAKKPSWDTLLDAPAAPGAAANLLPVVTRDFSVVRMAVLRSGEWQAFVHYGQAVGNHAQEEALTYELHEGTRVITADSGTVAYGSPYHRNYFSRGAANNVPLVDGQGQQRWNPGSVVAFDTADNRLVVDHPNYRNDVSVQRSFHLAADGFDEVTKLKVLSGSSQRRLGAAFHTPCVVDGLKGLQEAAGGTTPPPNVSTAYWKNPAAYSAAGAWSARLSCGGRDYTVSVSAGGPQRVFLAKAPDVPLPKERNVLYYEVVGREVVFEFKLAPAR